MGSCGETFGSKFNFILFIKMRFKFTIIFLNFLIPFVSLRVVTNIANDDSTRDVRELFFNDTVEDQDNDVIQKIPDLVSNILDGNGTTQQSNIDSKTLKNLLENNLIEEFPNFGIDIDIINGDVDKENEDMGFNVALNISKKVNDAKKVINMSVNQDPEIKMETQSKNMWKPVTVKPLYTMRSSRRTTFTKHLILLFIPSFLL